MILENITVVDLSKQLAGPQTSMVLADLGAKVIKIEEPKKGDDTRYFAPFKGSESCFFLACNRNKKSLTLNLKTEEGRRILYQLIKSADVVIEGFITGVAEKLKIDYETLKKIKPDLIYCSISGFGRKGPLATKGAYDLIAQAYGGLLSVTGYGPEHPPTRAGYSVSDITTGLIAAIAILSGLIYRNNTGEGQHVEASLLSTQVCLMSYLATSYEATKIVPTSFGLSHGSLQPYGGFKALDGSIILGLSNEQQWKKFCEIPYFAHFATEPLYATNQIRVENKDKLKEDIENILAEYEVEKIIADLEAKNIPCSPINNVKQVVENPYIYNEMLVEMEHPKSGKFIAPQLPFKMSKYEPNMRHYPPLLGEHTVEILADLGYNSAQIKELLGSNVI